MKIAIGCDHGGIAVKKQIIELLNQLGMDVNDRGCFAEDSVDYPDFARQVCELVLAGECDRGVLICGTGIGMSMAANRYKGIRAALCHEQFTAEMSRAHNDANVLCLGARVIGPALINAIVQKWLSTEFEGGRHLRRIEMF